MSEAQTLEEVLASVSDVLFPAESGMAMVTIDSRASDGDTPLHVFCWRRDVNAARVLVAAGADVNAAGDMGVTPLGAAVSQDDPAMAELLLAAGADPDIRSEFGTTARELARSKGGQLAELLGKRTG